MKKILFALHSTAPVRSYYREPQLRELFKDYDVDFLGGQQDRRGWIKDITKLSEFIDSKDLIIAVDNGILAISLALEKNVIALFGGSEERCVVEQFRKYIPLNAKVLRSPNNDECQRPCSFQYERGYGKDGKCSKHLENGDCMKEITPEQIFLAAMDFLT